MTELLTTKELIIGLLGIGCTPETETLFDLLVREAPKLVGAEECSVFWKDDAWREQWRQATSIEFPDAFYRRATYTAKKKYIGIDYYLPGQGLTGWVAKHGRSLRIGDITDEAELNAIADDLKWEDKAGGFKNSPNRDCQRAFLAVPIKIESEVLGIIRIAKTVKPFGKFSSEDQELLETFAEHVATIINRVEEAGLKDLWEKLYLSGVNFGKEGFSIYLQSVANEVPKYLGAKACSVFLMEWQGRRVLRLYATTKGGPLADKVGKAIYELGEGLTGWVAKYNKSLCLRDVDDVSELVRYGDNLKHLGKHEEYINERSSFLAAPIHIGDEVFGVIRIAQDSRGKFFSSLDQRLLENFCRNLAVLLQNAQLFDNLQSEKDGAIQKLQRYEQELKNLGELLKDVANIHRSLSERFPDVEPNVKIGPINLPKVPQDKKKVFIGIPFSASYKNVYNFAIHPALERMGLTPWIGYEQKSVIDIMSKVFAGIQQSYIGIIDISEWNPNVLFELGVLYGQNHPVILLKQEDAKVPADLAGLEYISYGDFTALTENLMQYLARLA